MLKFNLAPEDELASSYWWVLTVSVFALSFLIGFISIKVMFGSLAGEISAKRSELTSLESKAVIANRYVNQYDKLMTITNDKSTRFDILSESLSEGYGKYKIMLVMDAIQAMKPKGVWFTEWLLDEYGESISISAEANDGLLVAEFVMKLRSTFDSTSDKNDFVSQVKFHEIELQAVTRQENSESFNDVKEIVQFSINLSTARNTNFIAPISSVFWPQSKIYRF